MFARLLWVVWVFPSTPYLNWNELCGMDQTNNTLFVRGMHRRTETDAWKQKDASVLVCVWSKKKNNIRRWRWGRKRRKCGGGDDEDAVCSARRKIGHSVHTFSCSCCFGRSVPYPMEGWTNPTLSLDELRA